MRKFKIMHIVMAKVWGGGEQYVYDVCKEMKRQGHIVFIVIDKTNYLLQQRYEEVATVIKVNLYFAAGIVSVNYLKNKICEENIDFINCHSGHAVLLCVMLKFLTGKKLVFFKHNAIGSKKDLYHVWLRKNIDIIICVSKLVLDLQTKELTNDEKKKFYLIYNGIDLNKFDENFGFRKDNNKFVIGYAGRLNANKGIDILLDSSALLYKKYKNIGKTYRKDSSCCFTKTFFCKFTKMKHMFRYRKRIENIIFHPCTKTDMPSSPEFAKIF